jgi:ABC-type transport system involved in multi-copper enzyme maturation permease subunit
MEYAQPALRRSGLAMIWTQTAALFVDAYRELNAKRLFWITLVLSLGVVVAFAFISITDRGFKMFAWEIPSPYNATNIPPETFYKFLFTQWAIPWWLGFIASILALISVGSIFPDFLNTGSIDLYLAKPISRLRLFVTKYLTGLLFVALQVLVFAAASFVVIGVKGRAWEFGIFLAVPLVTLFFSYLYSVCVLIGLVTRSTLAAILLTMLFWCGVWSTNAADAFLVVFKSASEEKQARLQDNLDAWQRLIDVQRTAVSTAATQASTGNLRNFQMQRDALIPQKQEADDTVNKLRFWHTLVARVRMPLPKTDETVDLMNRWLVEPDPIIRATKESAELRHQRREAWRARRNAANGVATTGSAGGPRPAGLRSTDVSTDDPDVLGRVYDEVDSRTTASILGTSIGFEAFILAIAAFTFCRRDF